MERQMNINVPIDRLKDRVCACGGKVFVSAQALKELPPIYSPSGKHETMMIPVGFACVACGEVISLRPEEPKKEEKPKIIVMSTGN